MYATNRASTRRSRPSMRVSQALCSLMQKCGSSPPTVDNPHVHVLVDGHQVSRISDFIMYSVEAEFIERVVATYGPCMSSAFSSHALRISSLDPRSYQSGRDRLRTDIRRGPRKTRIRKVPPTGRAHRVVSLAARPHGLSIGPASGRRIPARFARGNAKDLMA